VPSRAELTADMVINELRILAFANLGHYFDAQLAGNPRLLTLEQTAALQESTVDIIGLEGDGDDAVTVRRIRFKIAWRCTPKPEWNGLSLHHQSTR
jgi:hypothetical protein